MAVPLREVSLNHRWTLRRVQVANGLPFRQHRDDAVLVVPFREQETSGDRKTSPSHAAPSNVSLSSPFLAHISFNLYPGVGREWHLLRWMSTVTTSSPFSRLYDGATFLVYILQLHTMVPCELGFNASGPN